MSAPGNWGEQKPVEPVPPPPEPKKPGLWTRLMRWLAGEPPTRAPNEDDR